MKDGGRGQWKNKKKWNIKGEAERMWSWSDLCFLLYRYKQRRENLKNWCLFVRAKCSSVWVQHSLIVETLWAPGGSYTDVSAWIRMLGVKTFIVRSFLAWILIRPVCLTSKHNKQKQTTAQSCYLSSITWARVLLVWISMGPELAVV